MQDFLDRAFWDITRRQLAGEMVEELPYTLWLLWNEYDNAHSLYSTLADSFDPAGKHGSISGMRKRISERAERARQFRAAPPEPEETSAAGGGEEKEDCVPPPEPEVSLPSGDPLAGPFTLNWSYYQEGYGVPDGGLAVETTMDITLQVLKYITDKYQHVPHENIVYWGLYATNDKNSWEHIPLKPKTPTDHQLRWNTLDDLKELPTLLDGVQMSQLPLHITFYTPTHEIGLELIINRHIPDEEFYGTGREPGVIDDPEDDPYYPHDHSRAEEEEWRAQREEDDREKYEEWHDGGGQGCGDCIDVCRCHCYDSD